MKTFHYDLVKLYYVKNLDDYRPIHQWIFSAAYLFWSNVEDYNYYYQLNSYALTDFSDAIDVLTDAIQAADGSVEKVLENTYPTASKIEITNFSQGIYATFRSMVDYMKDVLDVIDHYYKSGFFSEFDSREEAIDKLLDLVFNNDGYYNFDFIMSAYIYYCHINKYSILKSESLKEKLEPDFKDCRRQMHMELIEFYRPISILSFEKEDITKTRMEAFSCSHSAHMFAAELNTYYCMNCGEELTMNQVLELDVY